MTRELSGNTRIRLDRIIGLKEWRETLALDKHDNLPIGTVRRWADGKLHEKIKNGWRVMPGKNSEYKKGKRPANNANFSGYDKPTEERKKELTSAKPVEINTADYRGKTEKECKAIAKQKYKAISMATEANPIKKDGIEIKCPMSGYRETKQHIANKNTLYVLGQMDTLIKNSTFMFEEKNNDPQKPSVLNMLNYGVKTNIDGEEYYTRIIVNEDKNGNFYYDNDSTEVQRIKASSRLDTVPNTGRHERTPYMDKISQWLAGVKFKINNKHDK